MKVVIDLPTKELPKNCSDCIMSSDISHDTLNYYCLLQYALSGGIAAFAVDGKGVNEDCPLKPLEEKKDE